jgi:ABC-2 type transport system permease protein
MPRWLQVVTEANPLRHLIVIVKSIFLKGSSTGFVLDHLWPLILIALITNLAANWMFRRKIA